MSPPSPVTTSSRNCWLGSPHRKLNTSLVWQKKNIIFKSTTLAVKLRGLGVHLRGTTQHLHLMFPILIYCGVSPRKFPHKWSIKRTVARARNHIKRETKHQTGSPKCPEDTHSWDERCISNEQSSCTEKTYEWPEPQGKCCPGTQVLPNPSLSDDLRMIREKALNKCVSVDSLSCPEGQRLDLYHP